MRALLDDAAVLQHDDAVGIAHRGQPVRNDESGAPGERYFKRRLDFTLGETVDAGGGFIQNEDAGISHYGPRKGKQLPLADGQVDAALAEHGIVALRQARNEVVGTHGACGALYLLATGILRAVADVFVDAAGKQERLLQHHRDATAQRVLRRVAHIHATDEHLPLPHIVEAVQQGHGGGFT